MIDMSEIYIKKKIIESIILETNIINGIKYVILTLGTHPCAYVGINEQHPFFGWDYNDLYESNVSIDVHCGLNYCGDKIISKGKKEKKEKIVSLR